MNYRKLNKVNIFFIATVLTTGFLLLPQTSSAAITEITDVLNPTSTIQPIPPGVFYAFPPIRNPIVEASSTEASSTQTESTTTPLVTPKKIKKSVTPVTSSVVKTTPRLSSTTTSATSTTTAGTISGTTNTPSKSITSQSTVAEDVPAINYYPPLDSLTPAITYLLCFLAMGLGIAGALLILRNSEEGALWVPHFTSQEPLFEQ